MADYRMSGWPMQAVPARVSGIELNQICDVADMAREDPDVIKLWIGESDLPTPDFIREAAAAAMLAGHTRYTYSLGVPALRDALSRYHARRLDVAVAADRFSVTAGGVQAVMQAFQAILEPGDEVIVPVPTWPNLIEIVRILGGVVVPVPYRLENGAFRLDLDDVAQAITPRSKAIAINSPSNPTGWIMPREQTVAVRDMARRRGLWLISDEVYAHFTYDGGRAPSFLEICEPTDRLIVVNTFSKNWCMTGWRIGWLIFPQGMATVFDNLSQYNTTSVATFVQHAAIAALDRGDDVIDGLVRRAAAGREIICDALERLPQVRVIRPQGTFYFFFAVDGMTDGYGTAVRLLKEAKVGVAPGSAFGPGGAPFLRVCFAVAPDRIAEASERIAGFFRGERAGKAA
ncbi:pyridoxal phosphate-dependent aminotransferase [Marinivivus vitaminiproducens]|uniref:pyridoxal phosphate-dependent aminotransferase n=1 Tax=Marinivivus vitaminiproducens TaxID=3035935 RepID=UPI0027A3CBB5|nr:pyridoxal phosphate-dependent aminotransferase [Geminicoccaceae bacterium SCSIO 64248]